MKHPIEQNAFTPTKAKKSAFYTAGNLNALLTVKKGPKAMTKVRFNFITGLTPEPPPPPIVVKIINNSLIYRILKSF